LTGDAISLDARILAVADCFDAMASDRPYRAGMPLERVISILKEGSGRQFDPNVMQAFLKLMEDYKKGESDVGLVTTPTSLTQELGVSQPVEDALSAGRPAGSETR